jgi:hypothetical protein
VTEKLAALIPEIYCDQMAMGLPSVTTAVTSLLSNFGETWASRRNIRDVSATPAGVKRKWCMYITGYNKYNIQNCILYYLVASCGVGDKNNHPSFSSKDV